MSLAQPFWGILTGVKFFQKNYFVQRFIAHITQDCKDQAPITTKPNKTKLNKYRKDGHDILQRMP